MSANLERGRLLLIQRRYDLAEKCLRQAVAEDPDWPLAHGLLSVALQGLDRDAEGLFEAQKAVHLAPDEAWCHYVLAGSLHSLDRLPEAEEAIRQAIGLNPNDADYHARLAMLLYNQSRWAEALEASEAGLRQDPQNADCLNFRGMSLTKLGRREEARAAVQGALALDPENAWSHAVQGWTSLESSQPKQALEHFREALRIDPDQEYARHGMVEALKARHLVYRLMLRWFLGMARLSGKAQWAVVIGLFVGFNLLGTLSRDYPALAPFVTPLLVVYVLFCVLTWIAVPLFNLLLRLNRFGRYALSREQIVASNWFGGMLAGAVVLVLLALVIQSALVLLLGIWLAAMLVPVALALQRHGSAKRKLCWLSAALGAAGLGAVCLPLFGLRGEAQTLLQLFVVAWLLFPWAVNVLRD